jgi:hypothetical protein
VTLANSADIRKSVKTGPDVRRYPGALSPSDVEANAALVADLLQVPEAESAQLLDDLEAAGCLVSATGPTQ